MEDTQNSFRRASGSENSGISVRAPRPKAVKTMAAFMVLTAFMSLSGLPASGTTLSSVNAKLPSVDVPLPSDVATISSESSATSSDSAAPSAETVSPSSEAAAPSTADSLFWQGDTLTLREITVSASFDSPSRSPLRLNTVSEKKLRERAAVRTYPELLKNIPSLYATSESGSYGDARLNIRGFKQENIAVLLNGIPISGLTSGNMYWNNWMGLADATYAIQVQKGIGSSMLSDSSVGGSVNIITSVSGENPSVEAGAYASHYGTAKGYFKYSSGQLKNGWSVSLMASYVGGKGYVDATDVSSFAYLLNIGKQIGRYNTILFTALGSPEKHEQRSSKLSIDEVRQYGLKYNKNWGWRDGEQFNLNLNNYFKPYFTLQHLYSKGRLSMKNSLYLAIGNGGGRWNETKGQSISSYRTADGLVDWGAAIAANENFPAEDGEAWGSSVDGDGIGTGISARNILSDYMAGHTQAGAIVSGELALGQRWKVGAGAHYQLYSTWEKEQITDLLGADYWWEDYEGKSLAGLAGRNPVKKVGDYIRTDNGKILNHGTLYASAEYSSERVRLNAGVSGFFSANQRWDRYNYTGDDIYSDIAWGAGFSAKAGLLVKVAKHSSIYLNGGYYSRLPYSDVYFSSGNNVISKGVKNEKDLLGELGYRFVYGRGGVEVTAYAAYWKNRTLMSNPYKLQDEDQTRYMITGLDAFHYGAELEAFHNFTRWLKLSAFASIGDWRWKNDVQATIYDDYTGMPVTQVNVYSNGLPVGDAPQTQVGATLEASLPAGFRVSVGWNFNDRMYADFEPEDRTDPDDRADPYRIPGYHLLGVDISWSHDFPKGISTTLFVSASNLLNTFYIERGIDGATHDLESFRGFWGFGRNFSFGLRLSFQPRK